MVTSIPDQPSEDCREGLFEELEVLELLIAYEGNCGPGVGLVKEEKREKVVGGRSRS